VETLDLARIHEQAVATLKLPSANLRLAKKAAQFFNEALCPILETHRAGRQIKLQLEQLHAELVQRTAQLATTNREVQRGIVGRKSAEAALRRSGENYSTLLDESLELRQGLRQLVHQLIAAQEDDRKSISLELQDHVAQSLLGINVRLISLKAEARADKKRLKDEILTTQRLVAKSAKAVHRVARQWSNK
jgi:signal transduction histidine kinase